MFWIHLALMQFVLSFAGVSQLNPFIPGLKTSHFQGICWYMCNGRLRRSIPHRRLDPWVSRSDDAAARRYPYWNFYADNDSSSTGYWDLLHLQVTRRHFERISRFFFAHMFLTMVYPLYKVTYNFVPDTYKGVVLEDLMPELVALTVDFFSKLLVSVCMSISGALYLSVLFIAVDVG